MRIQILTTAFLLVCAVACAQESHFQTVVTSSNEQFTVDLSNANSTAGATIALRNNSGSVVSMPWISTEGAMPPLNRQLVVAFLRSASVSDESFAVSAWQYVMNQTYAHCSSGSSHDPNGVAADPIRIMYGYGVGCCDQQAVLLAWLWDGAGYPTRVAMMTFHTVPEVYFGAAWHMLDPNHRVVYRNPDNSIASVAQILADPTLVANTADADGNDPVGWSATTMAQLYSANASSLRYVSGPWPEPGGSELNLLPLETLELRSENPWPDRIYHPSDSSETPLGPSAFGAAVLRRWLPFSDFYWASRTQSNAGVATALQPDGRSALMTTAVSGSVVYYESTPFPILSLQLGGEFLRTDPAASVSVFFSADGATWSQPVPVPLGPSPGPMMASVDLSQLARGSYSYFLKVQFTGASAAAVGAYELSIVSQGQMAPQMFPLLVPGQLNTLEYRDLSPGSQPRQMVVEVSVPRGSGELPGLTASSQIVESPAYSIARNYQARRLVDENQGSLAYPGSNQIDYVIHLSELSQVAQVSIWWGSFGTNPLYVNNWSLYGRTAVTQGWQLLASGAFPSCAVCDVPVSANVTDLRLSATGNNWIGAYEVKAYGNEIPPTQTDPSRTVSSGVPEDPIYSLGQNYGSGNLIDGDPATLAYPASTSIKYVIGLGSLSHLSQVNVRWGYFGLNPIYVTSWSLLGQTQSGLWIPLASGGFPAADSTSISLDAYAASLQLVAKSPANWIGAYELGIASTKRIQPASISSNVPDSGPYSFPTSNLIDDDESTLAYPGSTFVDYEVDFGANVFLDQSNIVWGYFGNSPIYVDRWTLYGQRNGESSWFVIARGGYPDTVSTIVPVGRSLRRLRIGAASSKGNWIGIHELESWGMPLLSN